MPLNNSQGEYHRTASPFASQRFLHPLGVKGGLRGILRVSNPPAPFIKVGNNRILKIVQRHITIWC
jgi:hypothetical protein